MDLQFGIWDNSNFSKLYYLKIFGWDNWNILHYQWEVEVRVVEDEARGGDGDAKDRDSEANKR